MRIVNPFARAYTPNFAMVDFRMPALKDLVPKKSAAIQQTWLNASFRDAKVNKTRPR